MGSFGALYDYAHIQRILYVTTNNLAYVINDIPNDVQYP